MKNTKRISRVKGKYSDVKKERNIKTMGKGDIWSGERWETSGDGPWNDRMKVDAHQVVDDDPGSEVQFQLLRLSERKH